MLDILIVEDNRSLRSSLTDLMKRKGHNVVACSNGKAALKEINKNQFDLIITDLKMFPVDGFQVLETAKRVLPNSEVIVITALGSIKDGVEAMKKGAYDFLEKPVENERLLRIAERIDEKKRLEKELSSLKGVLQGKNDFEAIFVS